MSIIIKSGDSANTAEVTAESALRVALEGTDPAFAGYVKLLDGAGNPIVTTESGALDVSIDSLVLYEQVDGSNLNTNLWTTSTSGMTVTQTGGFITLNAGAVTTAASYAILQSIKSVPLYGHLPLKVTFNGTTDIGPQAGAVMEMGIGAVSGTSAPTDGVFFRWNASGQFLAVTNNGGVETTMALTAPPTYDVTLFDIIIVESGAQFLINDELVAEIDIPAAEAYPTSSGRLPIFARTYTTTEPAVFPSIFIGQVVVTQQAMDQNKPWDTQLAGIGRGSYQSPVTAFGQTANHVNSTNPSSATLSNTAAGYATLGGRFQFAAVAGAVTDFALFAYQVPIGYQLFINSVKISTLVTGVAVGLTATVLDWAVGVNASAVSLATADGAGTWAPRRTPLGVQGFPSLSVVGAVAPDIVAAFDTPLVVDGGRYFHVILQVPVGAATASEVFRGDVTVNGYFE